MTDDGYVMSLSSWYGLSFRAPRISTLPRVVELGTVGRYVLDYAGEGDEGACWEMISRSRERGDNVAVNQLCAEDELRLHLRLSVIFTLTKSRERYTNEGQNPDALIIIHPAIYARTMDSCLAQGRIHRSDSLSSDSRVYDDLLALTSTLTTDLRLGYTTLVFSVASSLTHLVTSHKAQGYITTCTVPDGVKLSVGVCDELIMINRLTTKQRERRSSDAIEALCRRTADEGSDIIESLRCGGMLSLPFLPLDYVFEGGLKVTVRTLKFSESQQAFDIWRAAASKGEGYGLDECPTLEMFQLIMLLDHHCVVFDDCMTGHVVGLTFISDSWYLRNPDLQYGETSVFLTEEYRGRGLGPEATHLGLLLLKQLGYTATLNDTLLSNGRMFSALKRSPLPPLALGVIPDTTYTASRGWDDQVVLLADYQHSHLVQNFVEAAEKSLERLSTSKL